MSRLSLPRIRGSILAGHQRLRDHLVAAMRREPITWVDPLSYAGDDISDRPYPPRWQPWVLLALVFIIVVGIATIPVAAGLRIPDPAPPAPTTPPPPTTEAPPPQDSTCPYGEWWNPYLKKCQAVPG
jgi:hypothetical protein